MRSLLSPSMNWFPAQPIKPLSTRLRDHGFSLGDLLRARGAEVQATNGLINKISLLFQEENNLRTESLPRLQKMQEIIGYTFKNRDLLKEAFTHASYEENCLSYERLEYVGDSVLNILITKELYSLYPNLPPGSLSSLRAANVDTDKLARVAVKRKLHRYLRFREPVLRKQIRDFVAALPRYPLHSSGLINAPKVLADVVESTIGAIFVDSNSSLETTWEVAKGLLQPIITPEMLQTHPVTKLYETCQKYRLKVQLVDMWSTKGAYEVIVDEHLKARGKCHAKKEVALNRAANNAYNQIVRKLGLKHELSRGGFERKASARKKDLGNPLPRTKRKAGDRKKDLGNPLPRTKLLRTRKRF